MYGIKPACAYTRWYEQHFVKIKYPLRASKRIVISVACNCISAFIPVSQFTVDNIGLASVCTGSLCALERN